MIQICSYLGPNIDDICMQLNIELKKLSRWFKLNKLSLNIKKTNFITFRSKLRHLKTIPNVKTDENKIDIVKSSKFLGVIINNSLDWSDHISLVNRKVSKSIGISPRQNPPSLVGISWQNFLKIMHKYFIYWDSRQHLQHKKTLYNISWRAGEASVPPVAHACERPWQRWL